jgi:integrase
MRASKGSIQKLDAGYYKVTISIGYSSKTGKWQRKSKRVRGSRREAESVFAQMLLKETGITETPTLNELIPDYLAFVKDKVRTPTYTEYKRLCENISSARFAKYPIKDLSKHERAVREWLNGFERGFAKKSYYKALRQVLNYAKRRNLLTISPLDNIEEPKVDRKSINTITTSQLPFYLKAVRDTDIEAGILIMLYMGLRRSEALARKWSDINFEEQTLAIYSSVRELKGGCVEFGRTKTEKSTRIDYIPKPCLERLSQIKRGVWLCEHENKLMLPNLFSKKWRRYIKHADLPPIPIKDLRHSCGTMLIREMGANISDVAELLGHSSTRTTEQFYLQQSKTSKKRVQNLWE